MADDEEARHRGLRIRRRRLLILLIDVLSGASGDLFAFVDVSPHLWNRVRDRAVVVAT